MQANGVIAGLVASWIKALTEPRLQAVAERIRHGVFVVENLDTAELARDGVREFALILTHPKLRGATGAWTSPIALV